MKKKVFYFFILFIFFGCATPKPTGPKVAVMPAPGKPFDLFVAEDNECRGYAYEYITANPKKGMSAGTKTALAGTAIGTAAGALIGGGPRGAAIGGGVGLVGGSVSGSGKRDMERSDLQWSYDNAYSQCMYTKGNQVPGYQAQGPITPPKSEGKKL